MKRSARALELHMLDRAWTRYVNGNGAGLDWGRCLLMKWLRACISSSLGLSLSLDIGLLLKLNEYLKRRKAEREKNQSKTKWNQTKWNFCHGAIWRYKRCFSIESICRQKLFKFSNRHMCVQWVGQWWGRGGPEEKPYWKQCAINNNINISNTIIIWVLLGLSSFFGHATQLQMILPTKTPSSMICSTQEKSKKQEEVWQQKC